MNIFSEGLKKIVDVLNTESIEYMIVGGFAVSFFNRARTTNDIDLVVQIRENHVGKILKHFPQWQEFEDSFKDDVRRGMIFNITDFNTGIRYDFMTFQDNEYEWAAFERKQLVEFFDISCFVSSKEDLLISKFKWHNISPSEKQMEDIRFLLLDEQLEGDYLLFWTKKLKLETYGLLGN